MTIQKKTITHLSKILIANLVSFQIEGYKIMSKMIDEKVSFYVLQHKKNKNRLSLVLDKRYNMITILKNGKLLKRIQCL